MEAAEKNVSRIDYAWFTLGSGDTENARAQYNSRALSTPM